MVRPRRMNRPASVTMNEGRPVRTTTMPLIQPTAAATAKARMMHSHKRPAPDHGRDRQHHAGGADHRAHRQVELAADHQQRRGDGDDAELGRHLEEGDDAQGREHAGAARRRRRRTGRPGSCRRPHPARAGPSAGGRAGSRPRARRGPAPWWRPCRWPPCVGGRLAPAAPAPAGRGRAERQRMPLALRSITWAAVSLVTKPGPVITVPAGISAVLVVERQQRDRQVALQELLLVDREQHLAVADRLQHAGRQVEGAELDLAQHVQLLERRERRLGRRRAQRQHAVDVGRWRRTAP